MRREFVTVSAGESLLEAQQIMRLARLRHLLVERDGVLVGVISYRDLQDLAVARLENDPAASDPHPLGSIAVEGVMAASPVIISPETPLDEAARRLSRLGLGCLPVVEEGDGGPRVVGLLTETDLLRAAYDPWFRRL